MAKLKKRRLAEVTSRQAAGVTSQQAAEVTPRQAAKVTSRQAAKVTPQQAAKVTPRQAAGVTPGQVAEVTPGQFAEVTSGQIAEVTPGQVAEVTSGQGAVIASEQNVEATSGQVEVASNSESGSDSGSDTVTDSDSDHESTRGRTVLAGVKKVIQKGKKICLEWNAAKVPCGEHRALFGTYIGVIVREQVSISYEEWSHVPAEIVNEVYNDITKGFTVLPDRRKWVVRRAAERWRAFKARLVRSYLYKRSGGIRKKAPLKYPFISDKEWEKFTAYCTSDKFKEMSEKNRERANKKTSRYRGGRKGYLHYEMEIAKEFEAQGIHIEKVPRHLSWLKAHENKEDKTFAPGDMEIAEAIKTLDAQAKKGEVSATGRDDILAKVLSKPEHGGSVRGVGSGISNKEYFGFAKRPKVGQMMEQIQTLQSQLTRMTNMQNFMMAFFMASNQPSIMQPNPELMRQFMAGGSGIGFGQTNGVNSQFGGLGGQSGGSSGAWGGFGQLSPFGNGGPGPLSGIVQNVPEPLASSEPQARLHCEPLVSSEPQARLRCVPEKGRVSESMTATKKGLVSNSKPAKKRGRPLKKRSGDPLSGNVQNVLEPPVSSEPQARLHYEPQVSSEPQAHLHCVPEKGRVSESKTATKKSNVSNSNAATKKGRPLKKRSDLFSGNGQNVLVPPVSSEPQAHLYGEPLVSSEPQALLYGEPLVSSESQARLHCEPEKGLVPVPKTVTKKGRTLRKRRTIS